LSEFIPGLEKFGSIGGKVSLKGTVKWNALEMVKAIGATSAMYGGPVSKAVARALLGAIDGPSIEVEFDATNRFFADWLAENDIDGDGTIDALVEIRTTCDASAKSKHSTTLDPTDPSKVKRQENSDLDLKTDCNPIEVQIRRPQDPRKPWKDEEE
jgi:hypothetical protein